MKMLRAYFLPLCENQTMDDTTMRFCDWIFANLNKPGKTQKGLAAALGVAHPQITQLKKGERDLKVREVPIIAKYLEEPPPDWCIGHETKICDPVEVEKLLNRVADLTPGDITFLMKNIRSAWAANVGEQRENNLRGLSESASHLRASETSE